MRLFIVSADGAWLWSPPGRRIIDVPADASRALLLEEALRVTRLRVTGCGEPSWQLSVDGRTPLPDDLALQPDTRLHLLGATRRTFSIRALPPAAVLHLEIEARLGAEAAQEFASGFFGATRKSREQTGAMKLGAALREPPLSETAPDLHARALEAASGESVPVECVTLEADRSEGLEELMARACAAASLHASLPRGHEQRCVLTRDGSVLRERDLSALGAEAELALELPCEMPVHVQVNYAASDAASAWAADFSGGAEYVVYGGVGMGEPLNGPYHRVPDTRGWGGEKSTRPIYRQYENGEPKKEGGTLFWSAACSGRWKLNGSGTVGGWWYSQGSEADQEPPLGAWTNVGFSSGGKDAPSLMRAPTELPSAKEKGAETAKAPKPPKGPRLAPLLPHRYAHPSPVVCASVQQCREAVARALDVQPAMLGASLTHRGVMLQDGRRRLDECGVTAGSCLEVMVMRGTKATQPSPDDEEEYGEDYGEDSHRSVQDEELLSDDDGLFE